MSSDEDEAARKEDNNARGAKKFSMKNSLFVRNLSPQIDEKALRDVFSEFDDIEKVTFKPYPNNARQFYAQIDFVTAKGITEGSKISGTAILGVACQCGVVDPVQLQAMPSVTVIEQNQIEEAMKEEYARRQKVAEEDQRFRTVHIAPIPPNTTEANIRILCTNFGEIEDLRVHAKHAEPHAIVEFKERGAASVAKNQGQFLVDGKVLQITESKAFVDEAGHQEKNVHFQNVVLDAMNMRQALLQEDELKEKVAQVRKAAKKMFRKPGEAGQESEDEKSTSSSTDSSELARRQEKQEKKERREKKKARIEKRKKKEEAKRLEAEKNKRDESGEDAAASEQGPASVASTSGGSVTIDDEELEIVANTELAVIGSSSSSSSSSDDEEQKKKKEEAARKKQEQEAAKKKAAEKLDEDVFDIDANIAKNVIDADVEEARQRQRKERRREVRKVVTTSSVGGCCPVPGCVRPAGHEGPHIDAIGSTLIVRKGRDKTTVKKVGNKCDDKSRSRSGRRKKK